LRWAVAPPRWGAAAAAPDQETSPDGRPAGRPPRGPQCARLPRGPARTVATGRAGRLPRAAAVERCAALRLTSAVRAVLNGAACGAPKGPPLFFPLSAAPARPRRRRWLHGGPPPRPLPAPPPGAAAAAAGAAPGTECQTRCCAGWSEAGAAGMGGAASAAAGQGTALRAARRHQRQASHGGCTRSARGGTRVKGALAQRARARGLRPAGYARFAEAVQAHGQHGERRVRDFAQADRAGVRPRRGAALSRPHGCVHGGDFWRLAVWGRKHLDQGTGR